MSMAADTNVHIDKISDRLTIYKLKQKISDGEFEQDIQTGFLSGKKYLMPKYFYDDRGSQLFEKITETEEYYLTRTELSILKQISTELPGFNLDMDDIIELGSGSSQKTRYILSSFSESRSNFHYVPIDVSDILISSSQEIHNEYENIMISGIISDYYSGINIQEEFANQPKLFIFLGSSIGNFLPFEQKAFLSFVAKNMSRNDFFLVGFDLVKNRQILEQAYNDKNNITAEFNMNLLHRINREFDADFDTAKFQHRSIFNAEQSRIEMHLFSHEKQEVTIDKLGLKIKFDKNESIHTENSYKFTLPAIEQLASESGLSLNNVFYDDRKYFALVLFQRQQ